MGVSFCYKNLYNAVIMLSTHAQMVHLCMRHESNFELRKLILVNFKFGGRAVFRQIAKLKRSPKIPRYTVYSF